MVAQSSWVPATHMGELACSWSPASAQINSHRSGDLEVEQADGHSLALPLK